MKYVISLIIACFLFLSLNNAYSQANIKDSSISMHIVGAQYSMLWAGKDMAARFGSANAFGITYNFKLHSNFFVEFSYGYLWGTNVRETHILDQIKTSSGNIIDNQGLLNPIGMELRGHEFFLGIGKIIPVIGPNPNSGIFISVYGGFLQHKIKFAFDSKNIPQLSGDYVEGYDRLTNGFAIKENIGYINLSNYNLANWTIGFEFIQAFTQNRRDWNTDTRTKDTKQRLDLLSGLNIQIRIPFYKRAPQAYYYN